MALTLMQRQLLLDQAQLKAGQSILDQLTITADSTVGQVKMAIAEYKQRDALTSNIVLYGSVAAGLLLLFAIGRGRKK